jgi:thiamine biosynthesis lipoprotein
MRFAQLSFSILTLILLSCSNEKPMPVDENYRTIAGEAQGTTYRISYADSTDQLFSKLQADSIFKAIDQCLSVWVENSTISQFNAMDTLEVMDAHFLTVYFRGEEINNLSDGAFEPMIMPLVKVWGFGPEGAKAKVDTNIDSLLQIVHAPVLAQPIDFEEVEIKTEGMRFVKTPGQALDVNGIAQGYTVDVLTDFLDSKGIADYMVEVGGEVFAKGLNAKGQLWSIGIDKPVSLEEERALQAIVKLDGMAVATSGSYRKFYEVDGKRFSHTIDPTTGRAVDHQLLSATVMAPNCTNADAFATVFMVKGVEGTKAFLAANPQLHLEVFLIYQTEDGELKTYTSEGMKKILEEV